MNPLHLHIRRATVDDLAVLKNLWHTMRLPAEALESRLTDFQIVEREGEVLGALGLEIGHGAARLHSEGYADFSVADPARELFWERLQSLAANHGVFRLWTQETSPFWRHWGFQPANAEQLEKLPPAWRDLEGTWLTQELKNEEAIHAALATQLGDSAAQGKKNLEVIAARVGKVKTALTVIFLLIFLICLGVLVYLIKVRHALGH